MANLYKLYSKSSLYLCIAEEKADAVIIFSICFGTDVDSSSIDIHCRVDNIDGYHKVYLNKGVGYFENEYCATIKESEYVPVSIREYYINLVIDEL